MADTPLRVGLVGAGSIAHVAQLPALAANPDAVIAGVVTATEASARRNLERWPIERVYDSADHMIDLLRWFCGEAEEVHAHAQGSDPYQEDGTLALIRFASGAVGALVAARN